MRKEMTLKLGVVPVKRGPNFTTIEDALISKNKAFASLEKVKGNIQMINIDPIIENGIASMPEEIPVIEKYLKDNKVDAIFMLHRDFGLEEIIARVGKAVGKPLLLWGARDDAPDRVTGARIRDTQCGIFASSKVLQRYGVPFTYIENCHADDPMFIRGVESFCRTAAVVKAFNSMRILEVGNRPRAFLSVMYNEEELLRKFGIEIVPVSMGSFFKNVTEMANKPDERVINFVSSIKERIDTSLMDDEKLKIIAAMMAFIKQRMEEENCNGTALECWSSTIQLFGVLPCQVIGELTDMGYPISCEADIAGAVTSVLLQAADYNRRPTFFADLTMRHPDNDNAELLWHCGPFPYSLKSKDSKAAFDEIGHGQWELMNGDITIARLDGVNGKYSLFIGEAKAIDGPKVQGTYTWMEVDDWSKWERKLVEGPYIHHVSGIYGHYGDVLQEACKYIPGLIPDRV